MKLLFRTGKWVLRKGKIPGPNCRAECCDDGGGGGGCTDPDRCYYELDACRGYEVVTRIFISLRDYQRVIDENHVAPGTCLWRGCQFISWPTDKTPIPFADIAEYIDTHPGSLVTTLDPSTTRTCCDCAPGCRTVFIWRGTPPSLESCCCNCPGACATTVWSYLFHQRQTALNDPDYWIDTRIEGAGTVTCCYQQPCEAPQVRRVVTRGPNFPFNVDVDELIDFPGGGFVVPPDDDSIGNPTPTPTGECDGVVTLGGCLRLCVPHLFDASCPVGPISGLPNPPPRITCRTSIWSLIQNQTLDESDSSIPPRVFRKVTEFAGSSVITLSDGTGNCGGGCFDTTDPVPLGSRPLVVTLLSMLRTSNDTGLGDTLTRIAAKFGGDTFKRWFRNTTGRECGCASRANALNAKYPYVERTP